MKKNNTSVKTSDMNFDAEGAICNISKTVIIKEEIIILAGRVNRYFSPCSDNLCEYSLSADLRNVKYRCPMKATDAPITFPIALAVIGGARLK